MEHSSNIMHNKDMNQACELAGGKRAYGLSQRQKSIEIRRRQMSQRISRGKRTYKVAKGKEISGTAYEWKPGS